MDYMKTQKRFRHLFKGDKEKDSLERIQAIADANIEKYGLLGSLEKGEEKLLSFLWLRLEQTSLSLVENRGKISNIPS
jgi:hypothetical protein